MTVTYDCIATTTTSGNATTITFSSIPSTYTDLILIYNGGLSGFDFLYSRYNGDTGSNYSGSALFGQGTSVGGHRYSSQTYNNLIGWGIGQGTALTSIGAIHFLDYANTTKFKSIMARNANPESGGGNSNEVHLWRSTSAINSISLTGVNSRTMTNGSTFALYGVKAE